MSLEVKGMEEIFSKIQELGKKANKSVNKAILKGAEPILKDAVENAPERTGKGKQGLKISRPKTKGGKKYVLIGIDKGDISEIYYMKFHEFGASPHAISAKGKVLGGILKSTKNSPIYHPGIRAKPFLQPAFEKNKRKAQEIIAQELRKGLGL